jgi:hypothetical protein
MAHWILLHVNRFADNTTVEERELFTQMSILLLALGRGEDCYVTAGNQIDFFNVQGHSQLGAVCIAQRYLRRSTLLKEYTGEYKTINTYQMETVRP